MRHRCLKGHSCADPCIDVSESVISSCPHLCSVPTSLHCTSSSSHHHVDHKPSAWPNRNLAEASFWEPWLSAGRQEMGTLERVCSACGCHPRTKPGPNSCSKSTSFPRSCRRKCFSPQAGLVLPRELSPRTVGDTGLSLSHKGRNASGWRDAQILPPDTCVAALPPAPPSGPAFGGKVFEQRIELNEAIQVGPDPIDPVSLWEEEVRT